MKHLSTSSRPCSSDLQVRQVASGVRIHGCEWSPRFVRQTAPPHALPRTYSEINQIWLEIQCWKCPSTHLLWNKSNMVRDTMLEIFVKCPWYGTFVTAKYVYYTENSFFFIKSKFAGKCRVTPVDATGYLAI